MEKQLGYLGNGPFWRNESGGARNSPGFLKLQRELSMVMEFANHLLIYFFIFLFFSLEKIKHVLAQNN